MKREEGEVLLDAHMYLCDIVLENFVESFVLGLSVMDVNHYIVLHDIFMGLVGSNRQIYWVPVISYIFGYKLQSSLLS